MFLPLPMPATENSKKFLSYHLVKGMETNGSHYPLSIIKNQKCAGHPTPKDLPIRSVIENEGTK